MIKSVLAVALVVLIVAIVISPFVDLPLTTLTKSPDGRATAPLAIVAVPMFAAHAALSAVLVAQPLALELSGADVLAITCTLLC